MTGATSAASSGSRDEVSSATSAVFSSFGSGSVSHSGKPRAACRAAPAPCGFHPILPGNASHLVPSSSIWGTETGGRMRLSADTSFAAGSFRPTRIRMQRVRHRRQSSPCLVTVHSPAHKQQGNRRPEHPARFAPRTQSRSQELAGVKEDGGDRGKETWCEPWRCSEAFSLLGRSGWLVHQRMREASGRSIPPGRQPLSRAPLRYRHYSGQSARPSTTRMGWGPEGSLLPGLWVGGRKVLCLQVWITIHHMLCWMKPNISSPNRQAT